MNATTFVGFLTGAAAVIGTVVAYLGKRSENANARMNSEMDQIQEERDGLRAQLVARDTRIADLLEERGADKVELAKLRVKIIEMGGQL